MKHHNTHTNIRDFTVWKTHRMKHGSRSEVTDRVEKMPTPYLKANKRNSHPERTLDKKTNKKKKQIKKKTTCFFRFSAAVSNIFIYVCKHVVRGQCVVSSVPQLCVSQHPHQVSQPLPLPTETSNHPPLLSPSQCWDSRPTHHAQLTFMVFLMF